MGETTGDEGTRGFSCPMLVRALPLLNGLAATAWAGEPSPSAEQTAQGWQQPHLCSHVWQH